MRETCWSAPNAFEQGSLSFPRQRGAGELAPDFKVLGQPENMAPIHELSKVL